MKRLFLRCTEANALSRALAQPQQVQVSGLNDVDLDLDSDVVLDVSAPELQSTATVMARIVGRQPEGYLVALEEAALAPLRLLLGRDNASKPFGRRTPRIDCQLPARVRAPFVVNGCEVNNLSLTGMTLLCAQQFAPGMTLSVSVLLSGHLELALEAKVMWTRPDAQLLGLDFHALDPETEARLEQMLGALFSSDSGIESARRPARVLIADDDASVVALLSKVVADAGYLPVTSPRGDTALELAKRELPALAFLDIVMPGLDGVQLARALRAEPALHAVPIVLVSALDQARVAQSLTVSQANESMAKPVKIAAVRAMLAKYLLFATTTP
jgi:CheY-like chemotaxis protein